MNRSVHEFWTARLQPETAKASSAQRIAKKLGAAQLMDIAGADFGYPMGEVTGV
jgi:hypothetical protein